MPITHKFLMFGIKFVLVKNQSGYRGYIQTPNWAEYPEPTPFYLGDNIKSSLTRLIRKAFFRGLLSLEDMNLLLDLNWKTQLDIELWSSLGKLSQYQGKHYFVRELPFSTEEL